MNIFNLKKGTDIIKLDILFKLKNLNQKWLNIE